MSRIEDVSFTLSFMGSDFSAKEVNDHGLVFSTSVLPSNLFRVVLPQHDEDALLEILQNIRNLCRYKKKSISNLKLQWNANCNFDSQSGTITSDVLRFLLEYDGEIKLSACIPYEENIQNVVGPSCDSPLTLNLWGENLIPNDLISKSTLTYREIIQPGSMGKGKYFMKPVPYGQVDIEIPDNDHIQLINTLDHVIRLIDDKEIFVDRFQLAWIPDCHFEGKRISFDIEVIRRLVALDAEIYLDAYSSSD